MGGGNITENEKLSFEFPLLEEAPSESVGDSGSFLQKALGVIALALAVFALIIHTAIAFGVVEYMKEKGSSLLLSFVMPEYVASESTIPHLPEGEIMEKPQETEVESYHSVFIEKDFSAKAENGFALSNETLYNPDLYLLAYSDRRIPPIDAKDKQSAEFSPTVLVYHTHATEGYASCEKTSFRTYEEDSNMIAVGEVFCSALDSLGIETLHMKELFDGESWSESYENSHSAVLSALEKYPTIRYVFDLHRDCIGDESSGYISTTTEIYEKKVAQMMIVCGTDEGGSAHTQWRDNLSFALSLQKDIWQSHKSLMRPINLRRASFYQDTSPAALLLECGTCANTLEEAKRGAVIFACHLADYILGEDSGASPEALINTLCP